MSYMTNKPRKLKPSMKGKNKNSQNINSIKREFPKQQLLMPLEMKTSPVRQFKRRYLFSGGAAGNLTIFDIMNTELTAVTAILGYPMNRGIRIKRMQMWAPVITQGTAAFVKMTPTGGDSTTNNFNSLPEQIADSSISIDRPAYCCYKPDVDCPAGSWHLTFNVDGALVALSASSGAILDIDFQASSAITGAVGAYTTVLVGAVIGTVYAKSILGTTGTPQYVNSI